MTANAGASFELALLFDFGGGQILRYDVTNQVALGAFGKGLLGNYVTGYGGLALDPSRPTDVAILNGDGSVYWLNYSTGMRTKGVTLAAPIMYGPVSFDILPNGNLAVAAVYSDVSESQVRIFSGANGGYLQTLVAFSGHTIRDIAVDSRGKVHTVSSWYSSPNYQCRVNRYASSGAYETCSSVLMSTGDYWYLPDSIDTYDSTIHVVGGSEAVSYFVGLIDSMTEAYGSFSVAGSYGSVATSHDGAGYFLHWNYPSPTELYVRDPNGYGNFGYVTTLPYANTVSHMVLVNAPEPNSWVALSLAGLLLLRRRR